MNLPFLLERRETWGSRIPATPGLRWIHLMSSLSPDLLDEVFLGFTADSCFLVSYAVRQGDFRLRFWLVPSDWGGPREWLQTPFAELSLEKRPAYAFIADACGIRFIQSMKDPHTFVILFCSPSTEHVSFMWGTLPDPNCKSCRQSAACLGLHNSVNCTQHFQLMKLCPDYHAFEKSTNNVSNANMPLDPYLDHLEKEQTLIPLCIYNYCSSKGPKHTKRTCFCPDNSTSGFHPSVCPETGRLRISWISQGQQIRVLSCSFGGELACNLPMGSYPDSRRNIVSDGFGSISHPPLAFQSPLLTSNYCSTCYFWPADTSKCRHLVSGKSLRQLFPTTKNPCVFSHFPMRIVTGDESWPDGHRHQILPGKSFVRGHRCQEESNKPWTTWKSSLLTAREHFFSCQPISYLAMLQDIHASYMHWAITPILAVENLENDENALSQSSCSSDANPEKLLPNQLCGQCHSYFDADEWKPLSSRDAGNLHHPLAHMEEVVFDLPEDEDNTRRQTERVIFTSPLEPNWILVYEIDHRDHHTEPLHDQCSLVAILDVASGRQCDPDEAQYAGRLATVVALCPFRLRYSGIVSRRRFSLSTLAARARGHRRSPFQHSVCTGATTLMELNNCSVAAAQSLSRLCDPQGGYAFYLYICWATPQEADSMSAVVPRLTTNITYNRFPEVVWLDLGERVRNILTTRILQSQLPLFVLITSGEVPSAGGSGGASGNGQWQRLILPGVHGCSSSASGANKVSVTAEYSSSIPHPQVIRVSVRETEIALDAVTRLTFKSPSTVDVSVIITDESISETRGDDECVSHKPFLWRCGLCVAQFTVIESSSLELIAAHLRLHMELRCCKTCATVLPNSALAVDAPEYLQHQCSSLFSLKTDTNRESAAKFEGIQRKGGCACEPGPAASKRRANGDSCTTWKRYCDLCEMGFLTAPQYQQHLKNVHSKKLYICPECKTTFNTKGNMTTHFQRVHNQSDSVTCPICTKRFSSHYNLDRHIRLVHVAAADQKLAEPSRTCTESPTKHGYLLLYTERSTEERQTTASSSGVPSDGNLSYKPQKD